MGWWVTRGNGPAQILRDTSTFALHILTQMLPYSHKLHSSLLYQARPTTHDQDILWSFKTWGFRDTCDILSCSFKKSTRKLGVLICIVNQIISGSEDGQMLLRTSSWLESYWPGKSRWPITWGHKAVTQKEGPLQVCISLVMQDTDTLCIIGCNS